MSLVELCVTPSWVYVYGPKIVDSILDDTLSARNPQAFWQNKKRRAQSKHIPLVDEFWRLYDRAQRRFPKGVIKLAAQTLKAEGLAVRMSTSGIAHSPSDTFFYEGHDLKDFDWQTEAPVEFFKHEFAVCAVPTRGGKTIIGLRVATAFVQRCKVLYLVNKVEAQKSVVAHWEKHFGAAPAYTEINDKSSGLYVLTYQSAANRDLSDFGMVIGDEIHGVGADTFFDSLMRCESAWYRLGLTGTHEGRSDGKDLWIEAAAGPVYYEVDRRAIIDAGLCASGVIWRVGVDEQIPDVSGWRKIEEHGIITGYRTSRLIECARAAWNALDGEGQLLVMVHKHSHGELFAGMLSESLGFEVPYISSKTSKSKRADYYEQLQAGTLKAAVASSIWNDSVTLPHVRVLVVAPGGKSPIRTRQILGRALTGNKKVIVVDALDKGHPTLKRHSAARRRAYLEDGYEVMEWNG